MSPLPAGYGIHTSQVAGAHPFSNPRAWTRGVARSAGWGVARCFDPSRIARPSPQTFNEPYLLSAPHPALRATFPTSWRRGGAQPAGSVTCVNVAARCGREAGVRRESTLCSSDSRRGRPCPSLRRHLSRRVRRATARTRSRSAKLIPGSQRAPARAIAGGEVAGSSPQPVRLSASCATAFASAVRPRSDRTMASVDSEIAAFRRKASGRAAASPR